MASKTVKFNDNAITFTPGSGGSAIAVKFNGSDVAPAELKVKTMDELINELKGKSFPAGTILITHYNPTCYWYWDGTQWVQYCV